MDFQILFDAGPVITGHALAAMAAVILGGMQFALPKGTARHRATGYAWVMLLGAVAFSGFFIHTIRMIGPFSPIHLLSVAALSGLFFAVRAARAGDIARHRSIMTQLYFFALLVAGAFTLLPGRLMHGVFFGD